MTSCKDSTTTFIPSHKVSVCFGYETALEILRAINPSKLLSVQGKKLKIPSKVCQKQTILDAIKQVENLNPTFEIKKPFHVLVKDISQRKISSVCISHLFQNSPPKDSMKLLEHAFLVSSAPFAFTQIAAQEKDFMTLLQLGFELCGTYRTKKTGTESAYQVQPLTNVRALRSFAACNPSIRGAKKAEKVLQYVADGSASPRETKLSLLLGLPMSYGGYGLGIPHMNYRVENNAVAQSVSGRTHLFCDLCWPEAKLDVEYQSREMHEGECHRIKDSRRTNALASMGWNIINVTNDEFNSMYAIDAIADTIRKYLGKRKRSDVSNYHAKKLKLRRQLGLAIDYE